MKKNNLGLIALLLVMMSSYSFGYDPMGGFYIKFTQVYGDHIAKLIVLGVVLFSVYEFYKTKSFVFLIIGMIIAIIVLSAPELAIQANTEWIMDSNLTN